MLLEKDYPDLKQLQLVPVDMIPVEQLVPADMTMEDQAAGLRMDQVLMEVPAGLRMAMEHQDLRVDLLGAVGGMHLTRTMRMPLMEPMELPNMEAGEIILKLVPNKDIPV